MRALLWLYPPAFRERYGEEISQLLASSRKPVRDVLDVVWHALLERMELTMRGIPRFFGFAAALLGFAVAAAVVADTVAVRVSSMWGGDSPPFVIAVHVVIFAAAIAVAFVSARAGQALARRQGYPVWTIAVLMFAVQVIATLLVINSRLLRPGFTIYGEAAKPTLLYFGAWLVLTVIVVAVVRRLSGRRAIVAAVLGGLIVLQVTAVLDIYFAGFSVVAESPWALAYWRSVAGIDLSLGGNSFATMSHRDWLTTMYTCAVLGYAIALARPAMKTMPATAVVS
jgi:hypothetical protein